MPDVVVVKMDKDALQEGSLAPKPDPRWVRLRRIVQFPFRFLWGLLLGLWALLPPRRPKK